jgi:hypothetical protein
MNEFILLYLQEVIVKKVLSILTLATVMLFCMSAMAADKVVVIPMGSSAKGTTGQVQYNDGGKTAGAEVYYDKAIVDPSFKTVV